MLGKVNQELMWELVASHDEAESGCGELNKLSCKLCVLRFSFNIPTNNRHARL